MDFSYENDAMTNKRMLKFNTLGLRLYWAYANQAMAWQMDWNKKEYTKLGYMLRAKLFKSLCSGTASPRTFQIDLKHKLMSRPICEYCGNNSLDELSIDHIFAISKGGLDTADNMVWACKSCNSSKHNIDLLEWHYKNRTFPTLVLFRNYIKLAVQYAQEKDLLSIPMSKIDVTLLPFNPSFLPTTFPFANELFACFDNITWYDIEMKEVDKLMSLEE